MQAAVDLGDLVFDLGDAAGFARNVARDFPERLAFRVVGADRRRLDHPAQALPRFPVDRRARDHSGAWRERAREVHAAGAALAGLVGHAEIYVSGGAEHQGPDGGGPVAVIATR